jgi:predicted neutral ceramidase superfamily lipid hydrolase
MVVRIILMRRVLVKILILRLRNISLLLLVIILVIVVIIHAKIKIRRRRTKMTNLGVKSLFFFKLVLINLSQKTNKIEIYFHLKFHF